MRQADQLRSKDGAGQGRRRADRPGQRRREPGRGRIRESEEILNKLLDARPRRRTPRQPFLRVQIRRRPWSRPQARSTRSPPSSGWPQGHAGREHRAFRQASPIWTRRWPRRCLLKIQEPICRRPTLKEYDGSRKAATSVDADVTEAEAAAGMRSKKPRRRAPFRTEGACEKARGLHHRVEGMLKALDRIEDRVAPPGIQQCRCGARRGHEPQWCQYQQHPAFMSRVEANAPGGLVGRGTGGGLPHFAEGGAVISALSRMGGGTVPVPATDRAAHMDAGAFVHHWRLRFLVRRRCAGVSPVSRAALRRLSSATVRQEKPRGRPGAEDDGAGHGGHQHRQLGWGQVPTSTRATTGQSCGYDKPLSSACCRSKPSRPGRGALNLSCRALAMGHAPEQKRPRTRADRVHGAHQASSTPEGAWPNRALLPAMLTPGESTWSTARQSPPGRWPSSMPSTT